MRLHQALDELSGARLQGKLFDELSSARLLVELLVRLSDADRFSELFIELSSARLSVKGLQRPSLLLSAAVSLFSPLTWNSLFITSSVISS